MSRKKRMTTEAQEADPEFFETPPYCVDRLLMHVDLPGGRWLEPGAGHGAIIRAVNARRTDVDWTACDIRPDAERHLRELVRTVHVGDFLYPYTVPGEFDLVLGNPPFSKAARFIQRGLELAPRVVYLLRAAFHESTERIRFFRRIGVPDTYVIPDRPSFDGRGNDSAMYAWLEFRREWKGRQEGRIVHLWPDDGARDQLELVR